MDYGTIISGVCEARYSSIETIINDAKLIAENCEKWFASSNKTTKEVARENVSYFIKYNCKLFYISYYRIHFQLVLGYYLMHFNVNYCKEQVMVTIITVME